ncbi:hypothetical protein AKJ57_01785 [candidate division MSBL1 archaeon SCGC-AAA259A05]|uniref:SpoVT-AbrB domain-containing protein n=1 Tax=candidate division MSBL1 archaeon SCGC-AAA259A05 TaxID=1698259 RepID=A0A133UAQ9_9EURY|nr:hypothetical protein AKJ57_01785 [candidate division MSBL1 archaeon SCGC-AAA259A05]
MEIVKVTKKGQATIPKHLRDKYGLEDSVLVEDAEDGVLIRPVPKISEKRGSLSHLFEKSARETLKEARKEEEKREKRLERI